jgi:hypothetical protein
MSRWVALVSIGSPPLRVDAIGFPPRRLFAHGPAGGDACAGSPPGTGRDGTHGRGRKRGGKQEVDAASSETALR